MAVCHTGTISNFISQNKGLHCEIARMRHRLDIQYNTKTLKAKRGFIMKLILALSGVLKNLLSEHPIGP